MKHDQSEDQRISRQNSEEEFAREFGVYTPKSEQDPLFKVLSHLRDKKEEQKKKSPKKKRE